MSFPGAVPLNSPSQAPAAGAEQTLWVGHPTFFHYFWSFAFGFVFAAVGGLAALGASETPGGAATNGGPMLFGLCAVGLGLLIIIRAMLAKLRRRYTVTTRKVTIEIGLIVRSSDEVRIRDIRSIFVRKSGLGGLFGIGSVEFSSAARDKAEIMFTGISRANHVADIVRAYQEP